MNILKLSMLTLCLSFLTACGSKFAGKVDLYTVESVKIEDTTEDGGELNLRDGQLMVNLKNKSLFKPARLILKQGQTEVAVVIPDAALSGGLEFNLSPADIAQDFGLRSSYQENNTHVSTRPSQEKCVTAGWCKKCMTEKNPNTGEKMRRCDPEPEYYSDCTGLEAVTVEDTTISFNYLIDILDPSSKETVGRFTARAKSSTTSKVIERTGSCRTGDPNLTPGYIN